jgi:5-dehydro-2-deoxygluconokinase
LVKGFAVGRTIFGQVARDWLAGRIEDEAAVQAIAERYQRLCAVWDAARLRTNAREEALS